MGTIAIMGDIGGQLRIFYKTLRKLGVSTDLKIPEGLTIINVGDIARMSDDPNLDSLACVELADQLIKRNPNQWIQLLGNHESPFIDGPSLDHWYNLSHFEKSQEIVSDWWDNGLAKLGKVLETKESKLDTVITHAGITSGFMRNNGFMNLDYNGISEHREFIKFLNNIPNNSEINYSDIAATGAVAFQKDNNLSADCLWASTANELYPSWNGRSIGFNQLHGHDTPLMSWDTLELWDSVSEDMRARLSIDPVKRHTSYEHTSGETFYTVDWVLKNNVRLDSSTWELKFFEDARIIV